MALEMRTLGSSAPTRHAFSGDGGRSRARGVSPVVTARRLLTALLLAGLAAACGDDGPAPSAAGGDGSEPPPPEFRPLPGDGTGGAGIATPPRDRVQPDSERILEGVEDIRGSGGRPDAGAPSGATDAGSDDADASAN